MTRRTASDHHVVILWPPPAATPQSVLGGGLVHPQTHNFVASRIVLTAPAGCSGAGIPSGRGPVFPGCQPQEVGGIDGRFGTSLVLFLQKA